MNPIIGITCFCNLGKKNTNETPYYQVNSNYIEPIIKCGGMPFIIPIFSENNLSGIILDEIDGLLLTGGRGSTSKNDRAYVEGRPRTLRGIDKQRYIFEQHLTKTAMKKNIPLLGMCRGMQMICETAGGELSDRFLDEIDAVGVLHQQESSGNIPTHMISIDEESQLRKILGVSKIMVNSFHCQYCVKPGKDFKASAWAKNNIIEAIESPIYNFALGLQFHPEKMFNDFPVFIKIFEAFIEKSREYHNSKKS